MVGSRWSSARTRLVLPPTEGAATTNRLPGTAPPAGPAAPSLNILHLLAHLLDQHLELQRSVRQFGVDGLRAERVGLAIEFLHEEIETLAAAAARSEHSPHFRHVSAQPADFLRDVDLRCEQRELLF